MKVQGYLRAHMMGSTIGFEFSYEMKTFLA